VYLRSYGTETTTTTSNKTKKDKVQQEASELLMAGTSCTERVYIYNII